MGVTGVAPQPRARLIERLAALLQGPAQVVWLGAPVGMGKTTLARGWAGLHGGTLHAVGGGKGDGPAAWAALFGPPPQGLRLVLDDLHRAGPDEAWAPWLAARIEALDPGARVLLLSRRAPPACFARLQLQGLVACLPAEELLFTAEEAQAAGLPAAAAGWPAAAGLPADAGAAAALLAALIDTEVLAGLTAADRALLASLAWMPGLIEPAAAAALAGTAGAWQRLRALCDQGLPAQAHSGGIGLLPALRDRLRGLHGAAAPGWQGTCTWLQHEGRDEEAIDAALAAGEAGHAQAWPVAEAALASVAPRWAAACRHGDLARQLQRVPAAQRSSAAWAALAAALAPSDAAAGRDAAMQALAAAPPGATPLRLAMLTQVIGAYFQTFDSTEPLARWLAQVPTLEQPLQPDAAAALAVAGYSALFLREPSHAELPQWQAQVQRLPDAAIDPNVRLRATMLLCKQAWYTGRHASLALLPQRAQGALADVRTTPYARLLWGLARQYRAWGCADPEEGRRATAEALALAQQHGVHGLDRHLRLHDACFAQWLGQHDDAAAQLEAASAGFDSRRRMEAWHLFSVRAAWLLERGDPAQALEAAQLAQQAAEAMGPAPLAMSLFIAGQAALVLRQPVQPAVDRLAHLAVRDANPRAGVCALLLQAMQAWQRGHGEEALHAAERALAEVALLGGGGWFGLHRAGAAGLLAAALSAGVQREAAAALVRAQKIDPPPDADVHWPWPVRIAAGPLPRIHVHGLPVALGPKAPMRPLQLLEELLEQGGSAAASRLADRLWPEAEGDRAMASFEIALRRLRALLVLPEALLLSGGVLALNRRCVWVEAAPVVPAPRFLQAGELAD